MSIAKGDQVNISDINEVLTRHQFLADRANLSNGIMDLCLGIFKGYQAIVDWKAKNYTNVLEVWLCNERMLKKRKKSY